MSTTGEHREHEALPLTEVARAALSQRGESLLRELDSMRQQESEPVEIDPLDPQAELALRQRGDELLSDLEGRRAQRTSGPRRKRARARWMAIAAGLVGIGAGTWLLAGGFSPKKPPVEEVAIGDPTFPTAIDHALTSPPIPEPSSALLALAGAAILIGRRRR